MPPVTAEEAAWVQSQPVIGRPSVARLRRELRRAGFTQIELALTDDGEGLEFQLLRSAGLQELKREQMLRLVITVLRRSGFSVGFSEVALVDMDDSVVAGFAYTAPLEELYANRRPHSGGMG